VGTKFTLREKIALAYFIGVLLLGLGVMFYDYQVSIGHCYPIELSWYSGPIGTPCGCK